MRRLRNAEEPVRRRWMFILSGATMAIVVGFWVLSLNLTLIRPDATPATAEKPGVGTIFSAGLATVSHRITIGARQTLDFLAQRLGQKRDITVRKAEQDFTLDRLAPVPRTPLP